MTEPTAPEAWSDDSPRLEPSVLVRPAALAALAAAAPAVVAMVPLETDDEGVPAVVVVGWFAGLEAPAVVVGPVPPAVEELEQAQTPTSAKASAPIAANRIVAFMVTSFACP